jgi:hypothetical protein
MGHSNQLSHKNLPSEQIEDIRFAAKQMSGAKRRAFEAEMALKYCAGRARLAKTVFGWKQETVELGLAEKRSGYTCYGAQSAYCGCRRWEEREPEAAQALREVAEAHAQQDPTFRSTLAYSRLTAQAALATLRERGFDEQQLPSASTMAEVLNRMGYRLRKVVKAKPLKKIKQTDAIFENLGKKTVSPALPERK